MEKQNITLSIRKDLIRRVKLLAVREGTSISGLMTLALENILENEEGYEAARRRHLLVLKSGADLGTKGEISWTREGLHDR